jgi:hypothetical protein
MRGEDVQAAYAKIPEGLFLQSVDNRKCSNGWMVLAIR